MKIFKFLAFSGLVLVLGAIDAADTDTITYWEMLRQILLGVGVTAIGSFLAACTAPKPKKKRRATVVAIEQLRQAG